MPKFGDWKKEGQEESNGDDVRARGEGTEGEAKTKMAGKVDSPAEPGTLVSATRIQAHAAVPVASRALVKTSTPGLPWWRSD